MPTVLISSPFDAYGGNEPYVFVSYAHIDAAAVYPEIKKMYQNGVRIWYDKGIEEGSEWPAEIEKALNNCTVFIVFLSKYSVESVNVRNEIHLALKKKKEFLAVYLEKTELKFGLELTISSLQHVTKRQTGEYWEKIWKFLTNHPEVFDPTKSQNVFTSANQSLVFNNDAIGLIDKYQNQKLVFPKITNKQKYFGLGVIGLLAIGIFAIAAMLFFGNKTPKDPASPIVSNTTFAKNKNDAEELKEKQPKINYSMQEDKTKVKQIADVKIKQKDRSELEKKGIVNFKPAEKTIFTLIENDLVLIPAGKFMMGSPESEAGRKNSETLHEVTITKSYYMGKHEVTQEQWQAVMGNNPSDTKGENLPVNNVSWNECQEFIKKLNANTNGGYRLPTEAEWEYACRAGASTTYSFGGEITPKDANYDDSKIGRPVVVGSYKPNSFGLFDMHGNVWEWCENKYGGYPSGAVTDPQGPATGTNRGMRGGSFLSKEFEIRYSSRNGSRPTDRDKQYGIRLAKTSEIKIASSPTLEKNVNKQDSIEIITPTTETILVAPFTETKAKQVQKVVAKNLQKKVEEVEDLGDGIQLDLILIPGGKFKMGSPAAEKGRFDNETQHEVTLTKPYYLGKHEVTQEQWEAVMGSNPSDTKGEKLPVTNISWNDCQEFITKLNVKKSGGYRLPTEEEWEYACRAGTNSAYSFGDNITPNNANCDFSNIGKPAEVGSYKPNSFGLYDMHGNVFEWCEDGFREYTAVTVIGKNKPVSPPEVRTPIGIGRVLRGGSFSANVSASRSSNRAYLNRPTDKHEFIGFRLAKNISEKEVLFPAPVIKQ